DDENTPTSASGSATVSLTNATPTISVTKTASPLTQNERSDERRVGNTGHHGSGSTDPVTLTGLTDNVYGNLNGQGTCATGGVIASGADYTCTFTGAFNGNAGASQTDTVTASAKDDENTPTSASGSATVSLTNATPTISVTKTASPLTQTE